jgi:pilus assembly protein TadC
VTTYGALCAAFSVALFCLLAYRPTRVRRLLPLVAPHAAVGRRSRMLVPNDALARSGLRWTPEQVILLKLVCAIVAALAGSLIALVVPIGPLPIAAIGYLGFVAPSLVVESRARTRQALAERTSGAIVEWTYALVASGRPVETALATLSRRASGSAVVDAVLERVDRDYTLGAPLHQALAHEARVASLAVLARLAERLEKARDLGQGSLVVLEDLRDELRATARDEAIARASRVEEKLTLVMTLCYLPALALLIVIPLFLTLLRGLFT